MSGRKEEVVLGKREENIVNKRRKRQCQRKVRYEKKVRKAAEKEAKKREKARQTPAVRHESVRSRVKGAKKKESKKAEEKRLSAQKSIPYREMARDGICRVQDKYYSKTIRFYDINYQLAQNEDKNAIFENWCDFLNYFDSSIHFQLSFINHHSNMKEFESVIQIKPQLTLLRCADGVRTGC